MVKMFKCMGLGVRVGLGGTASSWWQGWGHSLEADISPACRLVGILSMIFENYSYHYKSTMSIEENIMLQILVCK